MKKRILSGMLALLMVFSLSTTKMEVNAQTTEDGNGGSIQFVEISNEEMEAVAIDNMSANVVERAYNGDTYSFANSVSVCSETEDEMSIDESAPLTIAETDANIKVCTVSEAVMYMDLADECALMFRNSANNRISMVYRRKDGNIGWVEPAE